MESSLQVIVEIQYSVAALSILVTVKSIYKKMRMLLM